LPRSASKTSFDKKSGKPPDFFVGAEANAARAIGKNASVAANRQTVV
jgi:hypothetical protein